MRSGTDRTNRPRPPITAATRVSAEPGKQIAPRCIEPRLPHRNPKTPRLWFDRFIRVRRESLPCFENNAASTRPARDDTRPTGSERQFIDSGRETQCVDRRP